MALTFCVTTFCNGIENTVVMRIMQMSPIFATLWDLRRFYGYEECVLISNCYLENSEKENNSDTTFIEIKLHL